MLWILFVGLVAGILARLISPGPNKPGGFILTIVLGIAGAFLATFIGQSIGWYHADQGAGFIGATVGALLVLFIWNRLWRTARSAIPASGRGLRSQPQHRPLALRRARHLHQRLAVEHHSPPTAQTQDNRAAISPASVRRP